nr:hypothetical protein [Candidatus Sigynarchaeota archaeon]
MSITNIHSSFSLPELARLEFCRDLLARILPSKRWSGLGTIVLGPADVVVVKVVHLATDLGTLFSTYSRGNLVESFAILFTLVNAKKGMGPLLYTVPARITLFRDTLEPAHHDMHVFRFDDGTQLGITLAPQEPAFWNQFIWSLLENHENINECITLHKHGVPIDSFLDQDVDTWQANILGEGDTTNVIFCLQHRQDRTKSFVVKLYPKPSFNMTGLLANLLDTSGFNDVSHLQIGFLYEPRFLETLLGAVSDTSSLAQIQARLNPLGLATPEMFPFIHVFEFMHNAGDGGTPFWESASSISPDTNHVAWQTKEIMNLAKVLGQGTARFHSSLDISSWGRDQDTSKLYHSLKKQIEAKINHVLAILHGISLDTTVPRYFSHLVSNVLKMLQDDEHVLSFLPSLKTFTSLHCQLIHQDLHMGQLLIDPARSRFIFLDLEGDPQLSWEERLTSYPVEKDIASLLRSLSYIKIAALKKMARDSVPESQHPFISLFFVMTEKNTRTLEKKHDSFSLSDHENMLSLKVNLDAWEQDITQAILNGYTISRDIDGAALSFFMLERVLNECIYEARYRPGNVFTPLVGLNDILRSRP